MGWKRLQNAVNSNDLRNASDRYCTWGYHLWDTADPGSLPLRPARDCGRPTSQTMRPGMSDCSSYRRRCGWIASRREQRSSPTNPQPTLSSKHPEPASQSTQIKRRPSPTNHTCLRLGGAVTSCMYGHGHARTFTHARIFTGTRTAMVIYIHGYAHTHGASQPDETSVRLAQIKRQSNSLKCPAAASHLRGSTRPTGLLKTPGGHGYGIAWRCGVDAGVAATSRRQGGPARLCDRAIGPKGPMIVGPEGPTVWST